TSGPSATRSVHPVSARTHALMSVRRASLVFHVCVVIGPPPWSQALASTLHNGGKATALVPEHGRGDDRNTPGHARISTPSHRALPAHTSLSGTTRAVRASCGSCSSEGCAWRHVPVRTQRRGVPVQSWHTTPMRLLPAGSARVCGKTPF